MTHRSHQHRFSQGSITIIADLLTLLTVLYRDVLYQLEAYFDLSGTTMPFLIIASYVFKEKVKGAFSESALPNLTCGVNVFAGAHHRYADRSDIQC